MSAETTIQNLWNDKEYSPFFDAREIVRMAAKSSEPVRVDAARHHLDEFIQKQVRGLLSPKLSPLMRQDYIDARITYIMNQLHKNLKPWYEDVYFMSYVDTSFRFYDQNKREIYRADFSKLWNESLLPPDRLAQVNARAHEEEEKLKQKLERESILWGAVIIEWTITGAYLWLATDAYARWTMRWVKNWLNAIDRTTRIIKNIWVKNTEWKLEKMYLWDRLAEYSSRGPEWIRNNTLKMLQSAGVYFDPIKKSFINIWARATWAMIDTLKKISLAEYRKRYGVNISEVEWKRMKWLLSELWTLLSRSWNSAIEMMSWAMGNGLHIVMFPVFFALFQKEPNSATLFAGLAEWAIFSAWAKAGSMIWNEFGPFWRFFGPLAWWVSAVVLGHDMYKKFDGDKKKWKLFNGQDMFSNSSSLFLHLGTWWWVNEYFDWLNDGGIFHTEDEARKILNGGMDVWFPMFDWQKNIQSLIPQKELATWLSKYWPIWFLSWWWLKSIVGMGDGGGGITPDIDFYKRKVAFNMNPWEWFNASAKWRSVDKWNIQVDAYAKNLQADIWQLLWSYINHLSPFNLEKNELSLKMMLQMRLGIMLMPVGNWVFNIYWQKLMQAILSEIDIWNKDRSPKNLRDLIIQFTSFMKIDASFVRMNQIQLDSEVTKLENGLITWQLVNDFNDFAAMLPNPKHKQYVQGICKRVLFGDGNLFKRDQVIGRWQSIPSEEHTIFNAIIDSTDMITINKVNPETNSYTIQEIVIWNQFVTLLERLASHGRNRSFQNRLAEIDPITHQVKFRDTSRVEGDFVELNVLKDLIWWEWKSNKSVLDRK